MKEKADTERKQQGSMMVEASFILPVCLFLIMAMAGAFQFLRLEESLLYSGFMQMRQCAVKMSLDYPLAKINRLYLEHNIITHTREEVGNGQERWIELTGIAEEGMFLSQEQWNRNLEINCRIYCRWNIGKGDGLGAFSDELRFSGRVWKGEDSISVWIFPQWGECYHKESCYVVGGEKIRTLQSVAEEQGYRPCQHCQKGEDNGIDLGSR